VGEVLAYPGNCELINKTLEYVDTHPDKHDQYAFNVVLADLESKKDFQYTLLDPLLFCNGAIYFSDRSPQVRPCMCPYIALICSLICALVCALVCAIICALQCPLYVPLYVRLTRSCSARAHLFFYFIFVMALRSCWGSRPRL